MEKMYDTSSVEFVLLQQVGIQQATVLVREDTPGQKTVVAYLLASKGQIATEDIHKAVVQQLPASLVPSFFVWMSEFPKNAVGEIDRQSLPKPESQDHVLLTAYSRDETIISLFAEQVNKTPDHIAVLFEGESITYQELDTKSNQLANFLKKQGVKEEMLVPICINRSLEMIISILAILKAGGAYVPIDPQTPEERIIDILTDVAPSVMIAGQASVLKLRSRLESAGLSTKLINAEKDGNVLEQQSKANVATALTPANLAYVIYTSGSTGKPKGVMIQHNSLVDYVRGLDDKIRINECSSFALVSTPSADLGNTVLYGALLTGGTLHVLATETVMNPVLMHDYFKKHPVDCLKIVPTHWQALCIGNQLLLPAKKIIFGGEALSVDVIERIRASGATCQIINHYGPTETTIGKLLHIVQPDGCYPNYVPLGRPFSNTQVYVCSEQLELCPVGVPGELLIGGDGVARGYLNQEALTAEKFIANPFAPEMDGKLYRTGDLVKWLPTGEIEFLGRIDNQVKINGYRIELGEIEYTLSQHPLVNQCVVTTNGNRAGSNQLIAYVVAQTELDVSAVTAYLSSKLPKYMVPARVMQLAALPLTNNGKIDRKALPDPFVTERPELAVAYQVPETTTEQRIADLWLSLLQLDKIGVNDSFFEIGGTSLLAMKTVAALKELYNYHLPITKLYDYKAIRPIACFLDDRGENQPQTSVRKQPVGQAASTHEVAVVGMAGRFPGADTIRELWDVLKEGKETIRFFSDQELDPSIADSLKSDANYVKARGVVNGADEFDPAFFGISPKIAELMDPQQRIFLEIAWEALEQVGYVPQKYDGSIGVFSGCRFNSYYQNNVLPRADLIEKQGHLQVLYHNDKDYISLRTAYALNLKGPAVTVQSACSTSLLAIAQAVESIRRGQCDMALAGGALITAPVNSGHLYQEGAMFSNDGHCRPFDAEAKGTVFSDGAGVVLLKSRQRAEADGDTIYAVIKGVGVNNDGGAKASFTAPSSEGQAGAIRMAIADAGVEPASISYVETHGTATPLGDPIEIEGLTKAFGPLVTKQFCALGSIKSNMGHLVTAAGVAGFIKTVLSLHHRQIPPSLFYEKPNPNIDFDNSPFYVNNTLKDWHSDGVRRAGVSSFGVGGTNVHVVLEEFENQAPISVADKGRPVQLVTWSAKTETSRDAYAGRLADSIQQEPPVNLADVAFTLQTARADFHHRRFAVAATVDQLAGKLRMANVPSADVKTVKEAPGDVVFLFPGQGAQYVNMGRELYENEPVYRQAIDECAELLQPHLDTDIRPIIYSESANGAADEPLKNTFYTQSALFVTEYALARLWMSWGIEPAVLCGHSLGEFVAAHLAGVFTLPDALRLIAIRGRLVSQLSRGSMLSVKLEASRVQALLPENLSLAAINSPTLCVVAGADEAIADFARVLDQREIPNRVLATSHAFHSAMMDPIVADFQRVVETIPLSRPQKRIVSTVSGTWLTDAQATDPQYWAKHLRVTVRFADALETVFGQNQPILVETGPGDIMTVLARQQAGSRPVTIATSLNTGKGQQTDYESVLRALGQLWLNGLTPNWSAFYAGQHRTKVSLPTYAFDKKRYWVDPLPAQKQDAPVLPAPTQRDVPATATETNYVGTSEVVIKHNPHNTNMRKVNILNRVKELLEDTSGVELEDVRPDTSFLEIGLDSLSLTQISLRLRKELGVPITFRQLNEEYATLDALVDYLGQALPAEMYAPEPTTQPTVQPVAAPTTPVLAPVVNGAAPVGGNTVLELMAQQLQILAQQVAVMQTGGLPAPPATTPPTWIPTPAPAVNGHNGYSKPAPAKLAELSQEEAAEIKKPFGAGARIERQATELTPQQQEFIAKLTERYTLKTGKSKAYTQEHRPYMADPRAVTGFRPLTKEIVYPIVVERSKGSRLWDIDGNEYIDVLSGFGSNMLGYQPQFIVDALVQQVTNGYEIGPQHALAGEVCKLLCEFTGFDRAALCSTGSEAVLGAMRIARTVTNRSLVVAFSGAYHGIVDEVIVRGSKKLKSYPAAPGIMPEAVQNMLILDYGTDESLRIIRERAHELAAVLVEPVQSRRPEFQPVEFMKQLRTITAASGTTLIFDEVITGFRMHPGGAQAMFGIKADLATYGKVIASGIPIGVIAGDKKYMDALDGGSWQYGDDSFPEVGVTYFAGTFVRHPLALATAKASLTYMKEKGPALQQGLNAKGERFANTLNAEFERLGVPMFVAQFSSIWKIKYKEEIPYGELLFTLMREKGVHVWDGFGCFITEAHTDAELDRVISLFIESTHEMMAAGFIKPAGALSAGPELKADTTQSHPAFNEPPISGAKLGRDPDGNPAWFMPSPDPSGQFLRVETDDVIRREAYFTLVDYNPFDGPEISHLAPITEPQLEIWMACQFGGDDANRCYNESNSIHFRGLLSRPAMERAVHSLAQRHEALRSVFSANGEHICFLAQPIGGLLYRDFSGETNAEQLVRDYVGQEMQHVFDLANGPLFRASLLKLSDDDHYLVLTGHHTITDGWSTHVILQDLGKFYSAYYQGSPIELAPAPSYAQHAVEQAQFVKSKAYEPVEKYWLNQYASNIPVVNLPTDSPRPASRTYQGHRIDYAVDPELVEAIKQMGVGAGTSFVTTLMAAFEVFLHRLTGQQDLVLGLPAAGQSFTGKTRMVGHFANMLPLRSHVKPDERFVDYLKQRKTAMFDAYEQQQITFGSLLKKLSLPRDPSRIPLIPVIFNIDMRKAVGVNYAGLTYETITSNHRAYESFELFLNVTDAESVLTLEWSYNRRLFRAKTIDRWMGEFEQLLRALVANPAVRINEVPVLHDTERLAELARWNQTEADYPREMALTQLVAQTATLYPAKTAITFNGQSLSYQALDERANQLAHYLVQQGIRVGDLIGVALDRSPDMLMTLLAVMKVGAAYIPLDPAYPQDRIQFMLTDSRAKRLITSEKHSRRLASATAQVLLENGLAESAGCPKTKPDVTVSGDNLAYVLYTSGSTGKPKGVLVTHRNIVNLLWSMLTWPGIRPDDVLLAVTTISFDIAGLELYLPLIAGATVALANAETAKDGRALVKIIREQSITLMQATPATYKMMLDAGWEPTTAPGGSSLNILCCGEPMSEDLAQKLLPRCLTLWNMYGPTETTIYSTGKQILASDPVITIGRPIHNTQVYILDPSLRPVAAGAEGEIYLAGDSVAQGYLNRPELTAERFVDNPFGGGKMYRTGDLGRFVNDGEVQCLGRIDNQVKLRGYRIELGEIENTLNTFEDVKEAVVMAREDHPGDQRLVAYVVPESVVDNDEALSWHEQWDRIYRTGEGITAQVSGRDTFELEVKEWIGQALKRVRALSPKRVMELGCGAGQMLFPLAPEVDQYIGTDYAESAIDTIRQKMTVEPERWQHVSVATAPASDFSLVKEPLDMVLMHSVAQYFPDVDYLLRVIEKATTVVAKGGCIFIGDMQTKSTLKMLHTADQISRSAPDTTLRKFKQIIDRRIFLEDEMMADTAFFYRLPELIPAIKGVDVQLREGKYSNEATKYHYDVWLYIGDSPWTAEVDRTIHWEPNYAVGDLERELRANAHQVTELRGVANQRTASDYALFQAVEHLDENLSMADLKQRIQPVVEGIDPDVFRTVGETLGFKTHVRWANDGTDRLFDVVFIPSQRKNVIPAPPAFPELDYASATDYVRNPFKADKVIAPEQIQAWRQRAKLSLPDYMVPSQFVVLAKLPLTPNGKIDRKALPAPDPEKTVRKDEYVGPRNDLEKLVATVWTDLLKVERISIFDNFFELGGHSLIALHIMVRLEKETGKRLQLSALLEYSTIAKLAQLLQGDQVAAPVDSLVVIKSQGNKTPLYIVHGAGFNVLLFKSLAMHLDPEQPVYGLQPTALNGTDEPLDNVEEIAASYVQAVLRQNPHGPYALAGYSLGGQIAYEMASQLTKQGKQVTMLAMFDAGIDENYYYAPWSRRTLKDGQLIMNKAVFTLKSFGEDPKQTISYKKESLAHRVKNLQWAMRRLDQHYETDLGQFPVLERIYRQALRKYRPAPQEIKIDLFIAKKRVFYRHDFEYYGWKPFALKGVNKHEIPGDHFNIFSPPNHKEFAKILQMVLDNSQ